MVISRRTFIFDSALTAFVGLHKLSAESSEKKTTPSIEFKIRTLTRGPKHHFFGYYGICPWNKSGRYLVCLESSFQDRMPSPSEAAAIGLVDIRRPVNSARWLRHVPGIYSKGRCCIGTRSILKMKSSTTTSKAMISHQLF